MHHKVTICTKSTLVLIMYNGTTFLCFPNFPLYTFLSPTPCCPRSLLHLFLLFPGSYSTSCVPWVKTRAHPRRPKPRRNLPPSSALRPSSSHRRVPTRRTARTRGTKTSRGTVTRQRRKRRKKMRRRGMEERQRPNQSERKKQGFECV